MLQVFNQFLSDKERIHEKNIPYYVKWVPDCYRYFDKPETQLLTNDQNIEFINHLAKKHEDWQVKQAEAALRLYDYFLSGLQYQGENGTPAYKERWGVVETSTRDAMRLRHMSYSTEKTYLVWLRSFAGVRSPLDK